jgi:hypothetical protein
MRTTTAILTTLFSILALTTATPIQAIPPLSPPPYLDVYPGGSIFLVSDTPGQRPTEFRQPIDINKVTVLEPPTSAIANITQIKFGYFVNVDESKVQCHAYLDEEGLKPFRKPFTKERAVLETMEKKKKKVVQVKSVLCIVVV